MVVVEVIVNKVERRVTVKISETVLITSTVFIAIMAMSWMFAATSNTKDVVQYDCRLAEISVDYPITVKEQCRKLMEKH